MSNELLYPLTLFCEANNIPLPEYEVVPGPAIPQPYRDLLVHQGDMTSKLEAFHEGAIKLRVLHREIAGSAYRREVLLCVQETGLPVEYGAIEINLDSFDARLRELILEGRQPLGGLLNRHGIIYRSSPQAFVRFLPNRALSALFEGSGELELYGRANVLLNESGLIMARIVEVLRPCKTNSSV